MTTSTDTRWVQLRPNLAWSLLAEGQIQVETDAGKSYRFGQGYRRLVELLYRGTSERELHNFTANHPDLAGSVLMLEELQLLQYRHNGVLAMPDFSPRQVQETEQITPVRLRLSVMVFAVICAWQMGIIALFTMSDRFRNLPRISLMEVIQSELPLYCLAGIVFWIAGHEMAHASAARMCGVRGGKITWKWVPGQKFMFNAPPQSLLQRADVRFFIFSAGPMFDLLWQLGLLLVWYFAPVAVADQFQALLMLSLLLSLPNKSWMDATDMGQGMRAFSILWSSKLPLIFYRCIFLIFCIAVVLSATKLVLLTRVGLA